MLIGRLASLRAMMPVVWRKGVWSDVDKTQWEEAFDGLLAVQVVIIDIVVQLSNAKNGLMV